MRPAFPIFFLCGLALFVAARLPAQNAGRTIDGVHYVRISDWARANGLSVQWKEEPGEIHVTGNWTAVVFTPKSQRARINDIAVHLSWPLVFQDGVYFVASADLRKAIHPVLAPPKYPPGSRVRTICIDPGHGGKDPGHAVGDQAEKWLVLLLAREVAADLTQAGFKVVLTRSSDEFIELSRRPEMAKEKGADLFVSLHYNAAEREGARGGEVFCLPPAGAASTGGDRSRIEASGGNEHDEHNMLLAYQIQRALVLGLGVEDRGVRRARFAVLREAGMPAVLVEAGFLSNPEEREKIVDAEYRKRTARAIAEGIIAFQRLIER